MVTLMASGGPGGLLSRYARALLLLVSYLFLLSLSPPYPQVSAAVAGPCSAGAPECRGAVSCAVLVDGRPDCSRQALDTGNGLTCKSLTGALAVTEWVLYSSIALLVICTLLGTCCSVRLFGKKEHQRHSTASTAAITRENNAPLPISQMSSSIIPKMSSSAKSLKLPSTIWSPRMLRSPLADRWASIVPKAVFAGSNNAINSDCLTDTTSAYDDDVIRNKGSLINEHSLDAYSLDISDVAVSDSSKSNCEIMLETMITVDRYLLTADGPGVAFERGGGVVGSMSTGSNELVTHGVLESGSVVYTCGTLYDRVLARQPSYSYESPPVQWPTDDSKNAWQTTSEHATLYKLQARRKDAHAPHRRKPAFLRSKSLTGLHVSSLANGFTSTNNGSHPVPQEPDSRAHQSASIPRSPQSTCPGAQASKALEPNASLFRVRPHSSSGLPCSAAAGVSAGGSEDIAMAGNGQPEKSNDMQVNLYTSVAGALQARNSTDTQVEDIYDDIYGTATYRTHPALSKSRSLPLRNSLSTSPAVDCSADLYDQADHKNVAKSAPSRSAHSLRATREVYEPLDRVHQQDDSDTYCDMISAFESANRSRATSFASCSLLSSGSTSFCSPADGSGLDAVTEEVRLDAIDLYEDMSAIQAIMSTGGES